MITEATFVGAENLPPEIAAALDVPWTFLGEVPPGQSPPRAFACSHGRDIFHQDPDWKQNELRRFVFLTDDMIEVSIWFGQCRTCQRVGWLRQGPPFIRARSFVTA
jgi:hypothetical protein